MFQRCLVWGSVVCFTLLIAVFAVPHAQADVITGDATNFRVLYEGNGNQLQFNNSNVLGNIGIGAVNGTTGSFQGNGPGTITGSVEFNNSSGGFSNSGVVITGNGGAPLFSQTNVDTDLLSLNALSQSLSTEAGAALTISSGGSVSASSGTVDGSGNDVFTLQSGSNFPNGTFTINGNGTGTQNVVVNVPFAFSFNGSIVLTGGLTPDNVLFNFTAGNYATQSGGNTLTISTNGLTTMGDFLDVNGNIQINHSVLDGRLFGGDTQNLSVVSGADIIPEPSFVFPVAGLSLVIGLAALRKKLIRT